MYFKRIIFMQGEEAQEVLDIIDNEGGEAVAMEYLKDWDYGDGGEESADEPWGSADTLYEEDNYIMSYHPFQCYVSLTKRLQDIDPYPADNEISERG